MVSESKEGAEEMVKFEVGSRVSTTYDPKIRGRVLEVLAPHPLPGILSQVVLVRWDTGVQEVESAWNLVVVPEFSPGDRVRAFIDEPLVGTVGETELKDGGWGAYVVWDGDPESVWMWFVELEKVEKMAEFQKGDRVTSSYYNHQIEGTILEKQGTGYVVNWNPHHSRNWEPTKELVLVKKARQFKVGDRVREDTAIYLVGTIYDLDCTEGSAWVVWDESPGERCWESLSRLILMEEQKVANTVYIAAGDTVTHPRFEEQKQGPILGTVLSIRSESYCTVEWNHLMSPRDEYIPNLELVRKAGKDVDEEIKMEFIGADEPENAEQVPFITGVAFDPFRVFVKSHRRLITITETVGSRERGFNEKVYTLEPWQGPAEKFTNLQAALEFLKAEHQRYRFWVLGVSE